MSPIAEPMQLHHNRPRARRRARGLSLIEALISLAITATLLTAVAAAYAAASDAVRMNDQFFRAAQAARVSVNQIMAQVRSAQAGAVDLNSLQLTLADGQQRTYSLDTTTNKLMVTIDGVTPVTAPLASNVSSLQFTADKDASGHVSISMNITIKVGSNQIMLNGSSVVRSTVTYE
jgi:type II secretory pathway pseudopilin PulG